MTHATNMLHTLTQTLLLQQKRDELNLSLGLRSTGSTGGHSSSLILQAQYQQQSQPSLQVHQPPHINPNLITLSDLVGPADESKLNEPPYLNSTMNRVQQAQLAAPRPTESDKSSAASTVKAQGPSMKPKVQQAPKESIHAKHLAYQKAMQKYSSASTGLRRI